MPVIIVTFGWKERSTDLKDPKEALPDGSKLERPTWEEQEEAQDVRKCREGHTVRQNYQFTCQVWECLSWALGSLQERMLSGFWVAMFGAEPRENQNPRS
jgi:hypothetical protein